MEIEMSGKVSYDSPDQSSNIYRSFQVLSQILPEMSKIFIQRNNHLLVDEFMILIRYLMQRQLVNI